MSIAARPNVRAAVTMDERANKSSVRAGDRRICDDAQTGEERANDQHKLRVSMGLEVGIAVTYSLPLQTKNSDCSAN